MNRKIMMVLSAGALMALLGTACAGSYDARPMETAPGKASAQPQNVSKGKVKVYFTKDISPEGMMKAYKAMGWTSEGKTGVKLSTGESVRTNYLRPELIKSVVQEVNGTIVECNTAYGGNRSNSASHWNEIRKRGYLDIAPVDIQDEEGTMALPAPVGGKWLKENIVGNHFKNYNSYLVLSHFKGHAMAGFGGALKNMAIGFASGDGKMNIHSGGNPANGWGTEQNQFLESMAEADKTIMDAMGTHIAFINVLNRISIDCDCDANPAEPDIHDIGIVASLDPVAADQAGIDLVSKAERNEALINRIRQKNGLHVLEAAETLGVGMREYELIDLDQ